MAEEEEEEEVMLLLETLELQQMVEMVVLV